MTLDEWDALCQDAWAINHGIVKDVWLSHSDALALAHEVGREAEVVPEGSAEAFGVRVATLINPCTRDGVPIHVAQTGEPSCAILAVPL